MTVYPVVHQTLFTETLSMWSPLSSMSHSMNFNLTPSPTIPNTENTRLYHHDPVFYPETCIICGLPHEPTIRSKIKSMYVTLNQENKAHSAIISTMAPSPQHKMIINKKLNKRDPRRIFLIQKKRNMGRKICSMVYSSFRQFHRMLKYILPSNKRHNIYPSKE
ncbi:hypothetical protein BDB01DRAFT_775365 [Pilobolus umbonatus]|nr:hypothetical protein BDB01DRAFT_775365 [Pilobolus umbonatus]